MPPRRISRIQSPSGHPHHSWRAALGVLLSSLVIMVSAPLFVNAFTLAQASPTDEGGSVLDAVSALRTEVADLRRMIAELAASVDDQGRTLEDLAGQKDEPSLGTPGIPECIAKCRTNGISCYKKAATAPASSATAPPTASSLLNGSPQQAACRRQIDTCIQACRPRTTGSPVTCETRCAVSFGSCIRGAGNDEQAAIRCRIANRACLAETCTATSTASLLLRTSRVPSASCGEQCRRESEICLELAKFDAQAIEECRSLTKVCLEVACKGTEEDTPLGQDLTKICEDSCTTTFLQCQGAAATAPANCNTAYGTCRDNCRRAIGGEAGGFGAAAPTGGR